MARKQLEIPGTGQERIEELESAADQYIKVRDARMRMTEKEIAAKTNLLQVALSHEAELSPDADGNKIYKFDDEMVILKPGKRNVKVKAIHSEDDDEDED